MKKNEIILTAVILLAALLLWGGFWLTGRTKGDLLRITVDNELYGEYPLNQDQTIRINDTNVCEIQNGSVRMTEADCPDHLCMDFAPIDSDGGTIICLPNRVFLEIVSSDSPDSSVPDTVAS